MASLNTKDSIDDIIKAVGKANCKTTHDNQYDRIQYFKSRVAERGLTGDNTIIVIINADDSNGSVLADTVMPGVDWNIFRNKGEIPFARGLCERQGIQEFVDIIDPECGTKLRNVPGLAVVVVDFDTVEVFDTAC